METHMDERLAAAVALQKTLTRIQALESRLAELPEQIHRIQADKAERQNEEKQAEDALTRAQSDQRDAEQEIQATESHLEKLQLQVHQVKTNKEYEAMQHEIQAARDKISQLETRALEDMEIIETRQARLDKLSRDVADDIADLDEHIQRLEKEQAGLPEEIASLRTEQDHLRRQLPADLLTRLDKVLASREGVAVVACNDGSCGGCQWGLPPQVVNLAKRGLDLIYCERCSRLLYWDPDIG